MTGDNFALFHSPNPWYKDKLGCIIAITIMLILVLMALARADEVYTDNQIANAIYYAEGGIKTRHPYGIKSINTYGNKDYARKICLQSIQNAKKRWLKAGMPEDFIVFMGRRYSPPNINPNWVKLVKYFLKRNNYGYKQNG